MYIRVERTLVIFSMFLTDFNLIVSGNFERIRDDEEGRLVPNLDVSLGRTYRCSSSLRVAMERCCWAAALADLGRAVAGRIARANMPGEGGRVEGREVVKEKSEREREGSGSKGRVPLSYRR